MGLLGQSGNPHGMVSEKEVKLCALCGALNHQRNAECFTCGWRGAFEKDAATIHMAWQRLYDEFESVELEHLTGSRTYVLAELGVFNHKSANRRWTMKIREWWRGMLARRDARAAERERPYRQQAHPAQ